MFARALIVLAAPEGAALPVTHGRNLTVAILSKIGAVNPELAKKLHEGKEAYKLKDKIFKPLIHSKLMGLQWDNEQKAFVIPNGHCFLYVGWRKDIVEVFLEGIKAEPVFRVEGINFTTTIATEVPAVPAGQEFKVSGPVVTTKMDMEECAKHPELPRWKFSRYVTYESNPEDFSNLVKQNLRNKYRAICGEPYKGKLELNYPHEKGMKTVSAPWGDIPVIACFGHIHIQAEPKMLNIAYNTGLGKMNALGYGMLLPC